MSRTTFFLLAALLLGLTVMLVGCRTYPSCDNDDHCLEEREYCYNQKCSACRTSAHCPDGRSCIEGSCERVAKWCKTDSDCAGKHKCREGVCGAECENDAECPTSSSCFQGECH